MSPIPAVCQNCGTVWTADNIIELGPGASATFENSTVAPCPNCGGVGRIPDGVYTVREAVVALRDLSLADLARIQDILRRAQSGELHEEEAKAAVEQAAPGTGGLLGAQSQAVGTWVGVLLAAIAIIIALRGGGGTTINTTNIEVDELNITEGDAPTAIDDDQVTEIIEQILRQQRSAQTSTTLAPQTNPTGWATRGQPVKSSKVPRNAPCHCGSGKKFKNCHGP